MSKALYLCSRTRPLSQNTREKLNAICNALVPDNLRSNPVHSVSLRGNLGYAVSMSNTALHEHQMSVLLGFPFESDGFQWAEPRTQYPDGNYALFRASDDEIEVVSDGAGTRTIWYYFDEQLFIASTSQRAIIMFLEVFDFDQRTIPWILSTGSLGPQLSWDKRLRRLQADSCLLLDRKTWGLSVKQTPILFSESHRHPKEHAHLLANAIMWSTSSLGSLDFDKWILPLSGGYDSRAILCFMKEGIGIPPNLTTVTWGLGLSPDMDGNDASVAMALARSLGVRHQYYKTDLSEEAVHVIVNRFLLCGEGRIDHIAAYTDGLEMWRRFHDEGIVGVIRGDVGFSTKRFMDESSGRRMLGCGLCSDFVNLTEVIGRFSFPLQELPAEFKKDKSESFDGWRDRLYHAYRLPTILAALSDIKLSYIELVNPLLTKKVLNIIRSLPDNLRTDKYLFKKIVTRVGPKLRFSDRSANASAAHIVRGPAFAQLLDTEIRGDYAVSLLGYKFTQWILNGIETGERRPTTRKRIARQMVSRFVPIHVKSALRNKFGRPEVDGSTLAFRVFMIVRMHKILTADAAKFRSEYSSGNQFRTG